MSFQIKNSDGVDETFTGKIDRLVMTFAVGLMIRSRSRAKFYRSIAAEILTYSAIFGWAFWCVWVHDLRAAVVPAILGAVWHFRSLERTAEGSIRVLNENRGNMLEIDPEIAKKISEAMPSPQTLRKIHEAIAAIRAEEEEKTSTAGRPDKPLKPEEKPN